MSDSVDSAFALVFDFDGTLVDSNAIKWKAFEACFADVPADRREEVLSYCRGNNHTTRYEKFRHVHEKILGKSYTPEVERRLTETFDRHSTRQIGSAPEVPGAERFLRSRKGKQLLVLLSSTPHEILLEILSARGWKPLFDVVQGAPVNKAEYLRTFQAQRQFLKGQALFFGDTVEDAEAARQAGWDFIAVRPGDAGLKQGVWIPDFEESSLRG